MKPFHGWHIILNSFTLPDYIRVNTVTAYKEVICLLLSTFDIYNAVLLVYNNVVFDNWELSYDIYDD